MNPTSPRGALRRLAIRALLRLYPRAWRRRYGDEFAALLAQRPLSPLEVADVVRGALDTRWRASRGAPERCATTIQTSAAPSARAEGLRNRREQTMARARQRFHCSFCGKRQDQVRRLIAGPNGVYICDECVSLCNQIIADEDRPLSCQQPEGARPAVQRRAAPRWQRLLRRWMQAGLGGRLRMAERHPIASIGPSSA